MARGAPSSSNPASVRIEERARPDAPPVAAPEAPLGAGPGLGLAGALPIAPPPRPPPEVRGAASRLEMSETVGAVSDPLGAGGKRSSPGPPELQSSLSGPPSADSS